MPARPPIIAEPRDALAASGQERRQSEHQEGRPILLGRPIGPRAIDHRGGQIGPEPDALCRLPLLITQEQLGGLGRLAPVDPAARIALLIRPELPEGLADADPPPTMHALRHGRRDPLGGHQKRRQPIRQLLGLVAKACDLVARCRLGGGGLQRITPHNRSIT
jgi:hypothetical protein